MENFVVSARKYRPEVFSTVVGQESITQTLKNAIRSGHLAQSFLFCGPRGVGKTTCARILAKTINCLSPTSDLEACGTCESCRSFKESSSFNIYELDAASNNSVDDIRKLVEQVRIPPQAGKYKIYIIDEVHMLSLSAFNAFLKTLEEPPAYAKFILATTEKHKIIPTILSRCQIFDFKRISVEDIANHLASIAEKEEVNADRDALHIIAQKAEGGLRDALSMFDQQVSFTDGNLSYKSVIENLHVLDYDYYFKITDHILTANMTAIFLLFNEIMEQGFDGQHFISGLGNHFRNLLVSKDASTVNLLEVSQNIKQKYLSQAQASSIAFLVKALEINNQCDINYKNSNNKRLSIEIALMQMCALQMPLSSEAEKKNDVRIENLTNQSENQNISDSSKNPSATVTSPVDPVETTHSVSQEKPDGIPVVSMRKMGATTSLKEVVKQEENIKKNPVASVEEIDQKVITQEQALFGWNEYCKKLQSTNIALFSTFSQHQPVIKDGRIFCVEVCNKVIHDEIWSQKNYLLSFLKETLSHGSLELEIMINPDKKEKNAYTPEEKYAKMLQNNPALKIMRETFGADIDF